VHLATDLGAGWQRSQGSVKLGEAAEVPGLTGAVRHSRGTTAGELIERAEPHDGWSFVLNR
jgi:hypothetical protein